MYFVEKAKGISYFKNFDYATFIAVLLLSVFGLTVLYSATRTMPHNVNGNPIVIKQVMGFCAGIILCLIVSAIDYKDFKHLGMLLYLFSVGLLVLVLIFGTKVNDARSWFNLPVIGSFQPAELAKVAFVMFISVFLERIKDEPKGKGANVVKLLLYSAIPIALILKQPDFGTSMVFIFTFCVMIYLCNLKYRYILFAVIAAIPSTVLAWLYVLQDYQKNRIISLISPQKDVLGAGMNVDKSKLAIGSGQISGQGFMKGVQTQSNGVPVKESDFIFSVVGEEFGFIGAALVVLLVVFILLRGMYIAKNSRDTYGSFLVVGIVAMMAFHFFENIGMSMGIMPVTGIPLPFLSQGGSSMVTNFISIGVILSVSMRRKKALFNNSV